MTDKMKMTLDVAEQRRAKDAYMEARHEAMSRAGVLTSTDADEAGAEFDRIAAVAVREFLASLNAKDDGVAFALRTLENVIEGGTPEGPFRATPAEIDRAREAYCDSDDIEIDEVAFTSRTDTGTWVQAWVWLPHNNDE